MAGEDEEGEDLICPPVISCNGMAESCCSKLSHENPVCGSSPPTWKVK